MLTSGELAKLFDVSSQTIINWLDQGRMPYQRIGNGPRKIKEQDVLNFIEKGNPDGSPISMDTLNQDILKLVLKAVGTAPSQEGQPSLKPNDLEKMTSSDLLSMVSTANRILRERQSKDSVKTQEVLESQAA